MEDQQLYNLDVPLDQQHFIVTKLQYKYTLHFSIILLSMTILFFKLLCDTTARMSLSSLFHFLTQSGNNDFQNFSVLNINRSRSSLFLKL